MFKEKEMLSTIGVFTVVEPYEDEKEGKDYIQMDPYEKGTVDKLEKYNAQGVLELTEKGEAKDFDGFSTGDFFSFNGSYPVVRSNELFTKLQVGDKLLSFPNSKLMEGDK